MKEKTVETILPRGRIVEIKELPDGRWVVKQKVEEINFTLIEAESLSMRDKFMQYEPKTKAEKELKELICEVIHKGVKNFYCSMYDPAFSNDGNVICFEPGKMPAVGKSYNWWVKAAKEYLPERNSQLGTRLQYGAFLGVLIKKLIEEGNTISLAWHAVCVDSKDLGNYLNSVCHKEFFEPTGWRGICGFFDLANTSKMLAEPDGGFWLASGDLYLHSYEAPIADIRHHTDCDQNYNLALGWIVLS